MNRTGILAAVVAVEALTACHPRPSDKASGSDSVSIAARPARLEAAKARPDSGASHETPLARWLLPSRLREISGLALTSDGRLFAHGDENGVVTELDYRKGTVVKQFALGKPTVKADFEGIAIANDVIYMLSSKGTLYEFAEGVGGDQVDYVARDTHLGRDCEFEGVAFDSLTQSLLFACKHVRKNSLRDFMLIYRWKLQKGAGPRVSEIKVPLKKVIGTNKWKGVHPSDITVDPLSGNYVLVASKEQALIEITPAGEVVFARPLPGKHPQAEGVAITRDSILIVSDEAWLRHPAVVTLYRWP